MANKGSKKWSLNWNDDCNYKYLNSSLSDMKSIRQCKREKVPFKSKALNDYFHGGLSKVPYFLE